MFEKQKGNLLSLSEYHSTDIGIVLEALAKKEEELGLVQAKLRSAQETYVNGVPSSSYSINLLIFLFLFNYPDDNLDDTATSHYGDDTAPSPNTTDAPMGTFRVRIDVDRVT